jgi:hypothetical protein
MAQSVPVLDREDWSTVPREKIKTSHRRDLNATEAWKSPMAAHRDSWPIATCYRTRILRSKQETQSLKMEVSCE